jgi:hypothetical protein
MRLPARIFPLTIFLLVAFILTACIFAGDDGPTLGDTTALTGNGVLVCSEACAARGQCGTTTERGDVVLASTIAPSTRGHDLAASAGTPVVINAMVSEPVLSSTTGQEFSANYYQVTLPDRPLPAWVAGWCLAAP